MTLGRNYWRSFAVPGVVWLLLFVVLPAYAVLAMAMGTVDPVLLLPVPTWNPLQWNPGFVSKACAGRLRGGEAWAAVAHPLLYVGISLILCFVIGYPVAYYVARHARRTK